QAEDGIRDFHVTGVQTCALPISAGRPSEQYLAGFDREMLARHKGWLVPHHYLPEQDRLVTSIHSWLIRTKHHTILLDCCGGNHRSEERRVGKEGRARWSPAQEDR